MKKERFFPPSYYVIPFSNQIYTNQSIQASNIKHNIHQQASIQIFQESVPSIKPLLKKRTRLGHAAIVDHSIYQERNNESASAKGENNV